MSALFYLLGWLSGIDLKSWVKISKPWLNCLIFFCSWQFCLKITRNKAILEASAGGAEDFSLIRPFLFPRTRGEGRGADQSRVLTRWAWAAFWAPQWQDRGLPYRISGRAALPLPLEGAPSQWGLLTQWGFVSTDAHTKNLLFLYFSSTSNPHLDTELYITPELGVIIQYVRDTIPKHRKGWCLLQSEDLPCPCCPSDTESHHWPQTSGLRWSSCFSFLSSWGYRHMPVLGFATFLYLFFSIAEVLRRLSEQMNFFSSRCVHQWPLAFWESYWDTLSTILSTVFPCSPYSLSALPSSLIYGLIQWCCSYGLSFPSGCTYKKKS